MSRQQISLLLVGGYLWAMMILFGSIVLETFMVYPNVFHDPPASFATATSTLRSASPAGYLVRGRSLPRGRCGKRAAGSC
jgi:hypothetical protein